jgi:hypothetical protein
VGCFESFANEPFGTSAERMSAPVQYRTNYCNAAIVRFVPKRRHYNTSVYAALPAISRTDVPQEQPWNRSAAGLSEKPDQSGRTLDVALNRLEYLLSREAGLERFGV